MSALNAAVVDSLRRWREDPVIFVREVLKAEPDPWQAKLLRSVLSHKRTALKACKGPGKTCGMAWIGLWGMVCFAHPKMLATSITEDNLRDGLWAELAKWQGKSELLKAHFKWSAERFVYRAAPETWFISARSWSRDADPSRQADTLAGLHGDTTFVFIDESGSIPAGVVAAADASLSTGVFNRLVQAGNPTLTEGPLWDACETNRGLWNVIEISGDPDDPHRATRIDIEWAREQIRLYGYDSDWVRTNVRGLFPKKQSDKLLGPDECTQASRRAYGEAQYREEPKTLGVDVGGAGMGSDESVIFSRQGLVAFAPAIYSELDTMALVGQVSDAIERWHPDGVLIDANGIGVGVCDRLDQLGYENIRVQSGGAAQDSRRFANKRTEMWWRLAEWIRAGGAIPQDPQLIGQLTAPRMLRDKSNRMLLEPKESMAKRGIGSPDRADALAFTFAQTVRPRDWRMDALERRQGSRVVADFDPFSSREA